ncbi:hypothetical protein L7F22_047396 [Adiantum nelumboides]|nr:hypothetical protein [Adiantum nelumboides]
MGNTCGRQSKRGIPAADCSSPSKAGLSHDGVFTSGSRGVSDSFLESSSGAASSIGDSNSTHCINSGSLRAFSYSDLKSATRNFRPESFLGEGGFGSVFKGWLDEVTFKAARPGSGLVVAVKMLNQQGLQGHREWLTEVYYLGQLHHENLVKLIGFCAEDNHRLLVYEFMSRGSLENHLFRGRQSQEFTWGLRMKIAVGAAKGLSFLHDASQPIIYRDFKSSNVLLDTRFNAKLSDFGLAKDGPVGDQTHVTTRVMGTYGYAAPEYIATGHLTPKNDVYSFGVVLLEILTGRKSIDKNKPLGERNLLVWAKPYLRGKRKVHKIFDPQLEGQYTMKEAQQLTTLALNCLNSDPSARPEMRDVVYVLEHILEARGHRVLE